MTKPPQYSTRTGALPPTEGASAIPRFWSWFEENQEECADLVRKDAGRALDKIGYELARIDPNLVVEMGIDAKHTELIVSADGISSLFPLVEQTVAAAPSIANWTVIAFRQPKPDIVEASYNGVVVTHGDVRFIAHNSSVPVDVTFYVRGLTSTEDPRIGALFVLIDGLIGEYNTATRIGAMEFQPLSAAPPHARAFAELKETLQL